MQWLANTNEAMSSDKVSVRSSSNLWKRWRLNLEDWRQWTRVLDLYDSSVTAWVSESDLWSEWEASRRTSGTSGQRAARPPRAGRCSGTRSSAPAAPAPAAAASAGAPPAEADPSADTLHSTNTSYDLLYVYQTSYITPWLHLIACAWLSRSPGARRSGSARLVLVLYSYSRKWVRYESRRRKRRRRTLDAEQELRAWGLAGALPVGLAGALPVGRAAQLLAWATRQQAAARNVRAVEVDCMHSSAAPVVPTLWRACLLWRSDPDLQQSSARPDDRWPSTSTCNTRTHSTCQTRRVQECTFENCIQVLLQEHDSTQNRPVQQTINHQSSLSEISIYATSVRSARASRAAGCARAARWGSVRATWRAMRSRATPTGWRRRQRRPRAPERNCNWNWA